MKLCDSCSHALVHMHSDIHLEYALPFEYSNKRYVIVGSNITGNCRGVHVYRIIGDDKNMLAAFDYQAPTEFIEHEGLLIGRIISLLTDGEYNSLVEE
jgi:hypothetical protein